MNWILNEIVDVHYGLQLTNVEIQETVNGTRRFATFKDLKTGSEVVMDFGTLLLTPEHKPRELYKDTDLVDQDVYLKIDFLRIHKILIQIYQFIYNIQIGISYSKSLYFTTY